ncbi:MAG TPA: hypothetical protein VI819_05735 [Patescibacteria group bacterium]|nr:hypothetical protein [Patescibacteria group bacterium]
MERKSDLINIEVFLGGEWQPIIDAILPVEIIGNLNKLDPGESMLIPDEDSAEIFIRKLVALTN